MVASAPDSLVTSKRRPRNHRTDSNAASPCAENEETKLLAMAEQVAHFGSWEWDITKPRAIWSAEMFRIFGLNPQSEGLTLEEFRSFIHPDDLEEVTRKMQTIFAKPQVNQKGELDYRIIRKDGSVRIIHSERQVKEVTKSGELKVVVGVDQDVTEQRIAQQESDENIKLLALAEAVAHFGSWELNLTQTRAIWSPGMFMIFGVDPQELSLSWEEYLSFLHPDSVESAKKNAQIMMNSPLNHREDFDYRIIRRDGSVRVLHAQRQVVEVNAEGKAKVVVGVDQDVTEQWQAEEALRRSEERFRAVAEAANIMVYETDIPTGKIKVLRGIEQLVGYKPEEIDITVDWVLNHMHPDDVQHVVETLKEATENPNIDKYVLEYRFRHKNGHYIVVKDTAKAVKDSKGKTVMFIGGVRDITQRTLDHQQLEQYSKHLEELVKERTKQLVEYERLAAIGQTAGMVGHDIRNPLQALTGEVYLIKTALNDLPGKEAKQEVNESLNSIEQNINYINKIVADLQDYSRKLTPEYQTVNLSDLIVEIFETVYLPADIKLSINIETLPAINLDPTFTRRALTNLINNAIQAMPNGGALKIGCYQQDSNVFISIADTGSGITDEVKSRLFTPMFTTKAKGQGLGLAVVKRLVEAQGGSISFESTLGQGTKFLIKLPTKQVGA
ncbi:MAG: PAS domain-containing protein [Candidatus Bathyarchaeota archaeon]|nr:PAS domain-containing protein [Candidatus Bathyarchaeota archaeon]